MKKEQIYEFIRNNPVCALSTADENVPHVRFIMIYRAEKEGIIFTTGENKDLHRQLDKNPRVEMSFYNAQEGKQIRVSGTVEELEDIALKKQVVEDFPFLKEWVDKEGYDVLVTYRLSGGKATVWTIETNFAEKEFVDL
jgi:pyridoxamine 5'-phosphate oxidase